MNVVITDVLVTYPREMGLSKSVKDQYLQNPFYKIMHAPKTIWEPEKRSLTCRSRSGGFQRRRT